MAQPLLLRPAVLRLALIAIVVSVPALAFDVRTDSEGDVVVWKRAIELTLDPHTAERLATPHAEDAIRAAAAHLDDATPGLSVTVRAAEAQPIGFQYGAVNTNSVLALEEWPYSEDALAVTLVTLNARTNEILDADIAFNVQHHQFTVIAPGATSDLDDVQNTFTHELGHVLGLMHSMSANDLVMYPSAPPGETLKRELKNDDRDGLLTLYAAGETVDEQVEPQSPVPAFGCSSSGASISAVLLPLIALALLRRRPQPVPVRARHGRHGVLLVLTLTPALARADELSERTRAADLVALVQVENTHATRHPSNPGLIVTTLTLRTSRCLKGACAPDLSLTMPGGRLGDLEQVVVHAPVPAVGAEVLLLTRHGKASVHLVSDAERRALLTGSVKPPSPGAPQLPTTPSQTIAP